MEEPRTFAEAKRMLADCRDVLGWHHGQPCPPIDVERLAKALEIELHVDHEHGFPPGFTPLDLAKLIVIAYEDS